MNITEALNFANSAESLLFTGAGFSFGAKNASGNQIPLGNTLIDEIKKKLLKSSNWSLEEAAEELFRSLKADGYTDYLKQQFICNQIAPYHESYAKLPWMRIYTTNFDDVIEKAYEGQGKDRNSATPNA